MNTDLFEDTLRDLLRDTADAAGPGYLEPDADQVIGLGRRVVRRRRYATGLVAASIAGIAGLVGVAAMGPGADRTSPPAGTSSAVPSSQGVVTADLTRNASMGDTWGPAEDQPSVRVGVDVGRKTLTSSLLGQDGRISDAQSATLPTNPRASMWVPSAKPGLERGVLPAEAKDVVFVWAGDHGAGSHDLQPLPGTPYQAFAIWMGSGTDGPPPLSGLIWTDGTRVFDNLGGEVRSARDGTAVAFIDRSQGVFGLFDDGTSSTAMLADSGVPTIMTSREQAGSDTLDTTVLLVLPAGAREVSLTASEGATLEASQTHPGGTTEDTLVVARLTVAPPALGVGVEQVTWTNADGSPGGSLVNQ